MTVVMAQLEKPSSIYDISINWDGLQKEYLASNHFEIAHASKFSHARIGMSRAGL
jgi:hypothetical protein